MAKPRTRPLNAVFGVEIFNIDLSVAVVQGHYPEIRAAFETHSASLFRDQDLAPQNIFTLTSATRTVLKRISNSPTRAIETFQISRTTAIRFSLHRQDIIAALPYNL